MKLNAFLALLLSFCILLPALAQTTPASPPQPQKPSDDKDDVVRITTNLVQVDAVVTKDGKPVTNLTADDFEIYEDGRKQTITSFAYISNVPGTTSQPAAVVKGKGREVVPFGPVKANDPHRTIAFVVDDLGLSAESLSQVRNQLRKFIAEQLQPNDIVAILRTGGELGVLQQFTNDKRLLNRAVERLRWNVCSRVGISVFPIHGRGFPRDGFNCGYSYYQTTRALRFILDGLAQLPGRKSMVLLSDDIPRETQEVNLGDESLARFANVRNYSALLQRLAEKAIRSSVVICSVDTQGLQYTGPTAADSFHGDARQIVTEINRLMTTRSEMLFNRRAGGELLARQTGGFQVRNSNGYRLDEIVQDQSGYYLLGYRPTDETFNKRFHHIKAKVKRSGMSLRTRFGFFGVSEEEATKARPTASDATKLALTSPFAAQDINVDITSFFANDKAVGSIVRSFIYLDAKDMTFTPVNGRQQTSFELHGVIFGDNGSVVEQVTRGATLTLSQEDYEYAMSYGMGLTFDIPVKRPGSYQVRVAARDRVSSKIGSAGRFVDVPNLDNKRLAVSGVVLGTGSDSTGSDLANPGARRFTPNSNVYFAYIIYNAANESGALRNLVMQVKLFRDGKNVYTGPEVPIKATNQPDPTRIMVSGSTPLGPELEPGSYYLEIAVTEVGVKNKGAPVVQWVDFQIEK